MSEENEIMLVFPSWLSRRWCQYLDLLIVIIKEQLDIAHQSALTIALSSSTKLKFCINRINPYLAELYLGIVTFIVRFHFIAIYI